MNPCENCVFYDKEGYWDERAVRHYCRYPEFASKTEMCPTVQSYRIRVNLGLLHAHTSEIAAISARISREDVQKVKNPYYKEEKE